MGLTRLLALARHQRGQRGEALPSVLVEARHWNACGKAHPVVRRSER